MAQRIWFTKSGRYQIRPIQLEGQNCAVAGREPSCAKGSQIVTLQVKGGIINGRIYLNHERRISRLEGIIEQIDKRLGTIERVGFTLLAVLLAGVVSILAGVVSILVKLWSL